MFSKWDIIYISRFPETVKCSGNTCGRHFSLLKYNCPYCGYSNTVSNLTAKTRPILLWVGQTKWHESMTFAIPLSASNLINDTHNAIIYLPDYAFLHSDQKYHRPMRAVIHQATRIDGNVLNSKKLIGKITNQILQDQIDNKLLNWLFD